MFEDLQGKAEEITLAVVVSDSSVLYYLLKKGIVGQFPDVVWRAESPSLPAELFPPL